MVIDGVCPPTSSLANGTPPQLNTNHVRLMKVASVTDADTFTMQSLPGMMASAGFSTMSVNTSAQTTFENVANVAAMNMGDTVSVRGPMFMANGTPTIVCSKVQKR